jgi:hypothetical protein
MEITASALTDASGRVVGGVQSFCDAEARAGPRRAGRSRPRPWANFVAGKRRFLRIFETLSLAAGHLGPPYLIQGETGTSARTSGPAAPRPQSRRPTAPS